jgi:PKD repeat protein
MLKMRIFFCFILLFCFIQNSKSQLSGNYTLGGTTATSTNFISWSEFAKAYNQNGVSGNVKITVIADLTDTGRVILKGIDTVNYWGKSKYSLLIDGNGKTFTAKSVYEILLLYSVSNCKITNLTFVNTSNSTYAKNIRLTKNSNYNIIENCTFSLPNISNSTTRTSYIEATLNPTQHAYVSRGFNARALKIINNLMISKGSNSPGPLMGILIENDNWDSTNGMRIEKNQIQNFCQYGIYFFYMFVDDSIINNDISRINASNQSNVFPRQCGIVLMNIKVIKSNCIINNNNIHDIPYKNPKTFILDNFTGIELLCIVYDGRGAIRFEKELQVTGNSIFNINYKYSFYGIRFLSAASLKISNNTITNNNGEGGKGVGISVTNYTQRVLLKNNRITRNIFGTADTSLAIGIENEINSNGTLYSLDSLVLINNIIDSNVVQNNFTGIYSTTNGRSGNATSNFYRELILIIGNSIKNNEVKGTTSTSKFTGIQSLNGNVKIFSNIIGNNTGGYFHSALYRNSDYYDVSSTMCKIHQNTIYFRGNSSVNKFNGININTIGKVSILGNIIDAELPNTANPVYIEKCNLLYQVNQNDYWIKAANVNFRILKDSFSGVKDYLKWSKVGKSELNVIPNFNSPSNNGFISSSSELQNIVDTDSTMIEDFVNTRRSMPMSDCGALENSILDLKLSRVIDSTTSNICSGAEIKIGATIYNTYNTVVKGLKMELCFLKDTFVENCADSVSPKDSIRFFFTRKIKISQKGKIRINLKNYDDNLKNDTLSIFKNIIVGPTGSVVTPIVISNGPTYNQNTATDSLLLNQEASYQLSSPTKYTNADYGKTKKWLVSCQAVSLGGKNLSGTTIFAPTTNQDFSLKFTCNDSNYCDSLLLIKLKISDLLTGCDTIILRKIHIYPKQKVLFKMNKTICLGDTLSFINLSKISWKSYSYHWDFGTGIQSDTSNVLSPKFRYKKPGNYIVKLTAVLSPQNFEMVYSDTLKVVELPKADFQIGKICQNQRAVIQNNSTPKFVKMIWSFSDTSATIDIKDSLFNHVFKKAGYKKIILTANNEQCSSSLEKIVWVNYTPVANYNVKSSICFGNQIDFQNLSKNDSGSMKYVWYLGENNKVSTDTNPKYLYTTIGAKPVKLIVKNNFGCNDTLQKTIQVLASPSICDFVGKPDYATYYYGYKFNPIDQNQTIGGEANTKYTWYNVSNSDSTSGIGVNAVGILNFKKDGNFSIKMVARNTQTQCSCQTTKSFVLNRLNTWSISIKGVQIYPNPVNDVLTIKWDTEVELIHFEVINITGGLVKSGWLNSAANLFKLDLNEIKSGIYYLKLKSKNNEFFQVIEKI